jgi:cysteine-rich repeat protein
MFWNSALILASCFTVLGAASCTNFDDPAVCANGLRCPAGTICAAEQDICISTPCGNGILDSGEKCDDGNLRAGDGCNRDCTSDESCGNGVVDTSEDCDMRGNTDTCDADCTFVQCGDGFTNDAKGEECDDEDESKDCNENCTAARCGDSLVNITAGEVCDLGGDDRLSCDGDCTRPACGDGWRNPAVGELCDDGGNSPECNKNCTIAACNDGFINPAAGEECEDGNINNGDGCVSGCRHARCGDGYLRVGVEECDDGNSINTDTCAYDCKIPNCMDGSQNADESDLDCGGHCGASCEMLQSCSVAEDCISGFCLGGTCLPNNSSLAAGYWHTCALLPSGAVRCWGEGDRGRLGYGNTSDIGDNEFPSLAGDVDYGENAVQITAGGSQTCVLLDSGAVRCWGYNGEGRLGYGHTNDIGDNETPVSAGDVNVGGTAVQVAAGGVHTCALLASGKVRCWGWGGHGLLGYGNTNNIGDNETPASAGDVNIGGSVIQIATGSRHTCALLTSGAVRCWGKGSNGQLGYGDTKHVGDNEFPSTIGDVAVGGAVIQITAGERHTCALLASGNVRCWGSGEYGQLGYGHTNDIGDDEVPASANYVDVGGKVVQIAAGTFHTCALLSWGAVRCWGAGNFGRLGYGNIENIGDDETPASAGNVSVGGTAIQIEAGDIHTCARLDSGAIRCWGAGSAGIIGYGNTNHIGDDEHPSTAGDVPYL